MTLRNILHFPNPQLRLKSKPVTIFDKALQSLIDDMIETMYEDNGIGLAAPQIDIQQQLFVINLNMDRLNPMVFINPEITKKHGTVDSFEGCLSLPGAEATISRAETLIIKAIDQNKKTIEIEADGMLAICIQHEFDHLDGKLFIDHLSPLKRARAIKQMEKYQKRAL